MSVRLSIDVWRDSTGPAVVHVFQGARLIDKVTVIQGDCLDLDLEDNHHAAVYLDETAHG